MKTIKRIILLAVPVGLSGCVITEWLVSSGDAIESGAAVVAEVGGPTGSIIGLSTLAIVAAAKWWEGKRTIKSLVTATQKVRDNATPKQKQASSDIYEEELSDKVKKIVEKVKKKIK